MSSTNSGQKYNFFRSFKRKLNKNPNCNHNSSNLCYQPGLKQPRVIEDSVLSKNKEKMLKQLFFQESEKNQHKKSSQPGSPSKPE